jgi:FkbM family methyltransferase
LDIGALHGIFSLAFTKTDPANRVSLAADASPLAFSKLLYNIHKNPDCCIDPVECAVSNKVGFLKMAYEWEHAVACTQQSKGGAFLSVPSTTGDLLCAEKSFEPDVIKIDVEGHEIDVLEGLGNTLRRMRPLVFLEVHPSRIAATGRDMQELWRCIEKHSYKAQRPKGGLVSENDFLTLHTETRLVLIP